MNLRSFAAVGVIVVGVGLLVGCAGAPTAPASWDAGNRPQVLIPGAERSEVKGLAMGAARSKGWTIVRSSDDQLVVQRPVDPASPTALSVGAASSLVPPVVEVTSAFIERSDGVVVALGAEVVTQPPGEKTPKRVDYTESYRDALTQSLESLRASWSANRQRIASAVPPLTAHSEAEIASTASGAESENPLVRTWAETLEEETAAKRGLAGGSTAQAYPQPSAREPEPGPEPVPDQVRTPEPRIVAATPPPPPAPAVPERAPRSSASGPAPVVDGSSAVTSGRASPTAPSRTAILPPVPPEPVSPGENMLTLNQASGTGTWAYYAEQYARLRGCNLTEQGSILIETRSDGEIHKVPCTGADSFLLKCQNGVCRGLQ